MDAPFVFSNLPVELVRDIFEHAAVSDRATARNLALVSSAVRHWTDPILYHTVVLSSARTLRAFVAAIANKPAAFVAASVHNLGIFAPGPTQSIDRVLAACGGVRSLACGFSVPAYHRAHGSRALQALAVPREQHFLGSACRDGWDAALVGPTVTHLRLHLAAFDASRPDCPFAFATASGGEGEVGWARLAALPALTHLAVVYRPSGETPPAAIVPHLARLLARNNGGGGGGGAGDKDRDDRFASVGLSPAGSLPALELVLVQVAGAKKDASFAAEAVAAVNAAAVAAGGAALRVVAEHAPLSPARQWEDAVRGGRGVWDDAARAVCARLALAK